MHIICVKENLLNGLSKVRRLNLKSASLPILENILIETENKKIKLSSTDLEIGINCFIRGKIIEEGGICLPIKIFFEYVNLISDQQIEIKVGDNNIVSLISNSFKTNIKGINKEDFPLIPVFQKEPQILLKKDVLKKILSRIIFIIDLNKNKQELSGALFKFKEKKLIIATTDGFRLSENIVSLENLKEEIEVIIPLKTLQELNKILEKETEEDLKISFLENQVFFQINETNLLSRLVEGKFPDYQTILPKKTEIKARFPLSLFINNLKTVGLFSERENNEIDFLFKPKDEKLLISAQSGQIGESTSEIKGEISGEKDQKIRFNYRYLLEELLNIDDEEVIFEISEEEINPIILRPVKEENYFYLIMPLKE